LVAHDCRLFAGTLAVGVGCRSVADFAELAFALHHPLAAFFFAWKWFEAFVDVAIAIIVEPVTDVIGWSFCITF